MAQINMQKIVKKSKTVDLTYAKLCVTKLKSNHKNVMNAENTFTSLVFVDVITVASTCSYYEHGSRTFMKHITRELLGAKMARNDVVTKKYLKKLFDCCNNPITRELLGINQTELNVNKTFQRAEINSRGGLETFIKAQKSKNKPPIEKSEVAEKSIVAEKSDKEFIAEISKQLKARKFKDFTALKSLQSDIMEIQKTFMDSGFKETIRNIA